MRSLTGMGSRSKDSTAVRPRPSPELLQALRSGKASLRQRRMALPLREKVRQLLEVQRAVFPLLAKQRPLRSWEHPWDLEP